MLDILKQAVQAVRAKVENLVWKAKVAWGLLVIWAKSKLGK